MSYQLLVECQHAQTLLLQHVKLMFKVNALDTCFSVAYTSQTQKQQHSTIAELAADWHSTIAELAADWPEIMQKWVRRGVAYGT